MFLFYIVILVFVFLICNICWKFCFHFFFFISINKDLILFSIEDIFVRTYTDVRKYPQTRCLQYTQWHNFRFNCILLLLMWYFFLSNSCTKMIESLFQILRYLYQSLFHILFTIVGLYKWKLVNLWFCVFFFFVIFLYMSLFFFNYLMYCQDIILNKVWDGLHVLFFLVCFIFVFNGIFHQKYLSIHCSR